MTRAPKDLGASVRARLLKLSREGGTRLETLLVAYGLERILYRLSVSDAPEAFVLKGGMLVSAWMPGARSTRDLDFHGRGSSDMSIVRDTFADLMRHEHPDGLIFDTAGLVARPIGPAHGTGGTRLVARAALDGARIPITIDVGFGDAMATPSEVMTYPTLLDLPSPRVHACSAETVMAEKLHAVVWFAGASTRMKDIYDLWRIPAVRRIDATALADSLRATFERRATALPVERPAGLSRMYGEDRERRAQWRRYLATLGVADASLTDAIDEVWESVLPSVELACRPSGA